ncbi:MAG TPA: hypothetical protein VGV61_07885, partial [Thermoanaerobaculia bacterium]|nr:hypothetical protein [Thermoanaerobaculia bacterium]
MLPLPFAMLGLQLLLLLLARLLGRPLSRGALLAGWLLPLLLLAPWLPARRLLVPCNVLAEATPGLEGWKLPTRHSPLNDTVYQLLPWELEVRHALAARRLPLWSDRLDGGSSPWANPQAQVLSPVAMLARVVPIQQHLLACLALKLLLALQGAWLLGRRLGARDGPALVGGAAFALGGGILAWSLFPLSTAAAWAPWVVAGVVTLARRPRAAPLVAAALATAALLLAGHPETAVAAVALAAGLGFALRARRVPRRRFLAFALTAGLLGAALATPVLLPFLAAAQRSLRAGERLAAGAASPVSPAGRETFAGAGWLFFLGPFSPTIYGEPYGAVFGGPWGWPVALAAYSGMVTVAGAAAALARRRRRRAAALLLAWATTLLVASRFAPLEALLQRAPALRLPEVTRFVPVGTLALAVAAALGWEQLRRRRGRAALVAASLPLAAGVALTPAAPVAGLAILTLLAAALLRWRPRAAWAVLAAALLLDLVPWGRAQLPADDPGAFYRRTPFIAAL